LQAADLFFNRQDYLTTKDKILGKFILYKNIIYFFLLVTGSPEVHSIFLHRTNDIEGKYFAELVKELFAENERMSRNTEMGIPLYGRY
jgi:hypothetical protein